MMLTIWLMSITIAMMVKFVFYFLSWNSPCVYM